MDLDWQALMSSEVFRNYLEIELKREANLKKEKNPNQDLMDQLLMAEQNIREDIVLKAGFRKLQQEILKNPEKFSEAERQIISFIDLDEDINE